MASEYDDFLTDFYNDNWHFARSLLGDWGTDWWNADYYWGIGQDHTSLGHLINAVEHIGGAINWLTMDYQPNYPRYNIIKLFDIIGNRLDDLEGAEAPEITMEAMLSAMLAATNDEYKYFIGLVDAYRVGLMNKPFNAEYFAALARGFAE